MEYALIEVVNMLFSRQETAVRTQRDGFVARGSTDASSIENYPVANQPIGGNVFLRFKGWRKASPTGASPKPYQMSVTWSRQSTELQ